MGCLHYYYGDGKGKTTAAIGLAMRVLGHGKKAVVVQFLKAGDSGECKMLSKYPGVTLIAGKAAAGFTWSMDEKERIATAMLHNSYLKTVQKKIQDPETVLLVLDEGGDALDLGLIQQEAFFSLLDTRPGHLEIVVTGHKPLEGLMNRADYITEMCMHRHPYQSGMPAREGIEF